jgi:hypothetical protein
LPIWSKLDRWQQEAVEWILARDGCGLFGEQRTGKTWITAGVIEKLASVDFCGLLVVPLTNLESTWVKIIADELPQVAVARSLEELRTLECPKVLLCNYEALGGSKRRRGIMNRVRRIDWSFVVFDESQRLNNRGSRSSRNARFLRFESKRLLLSGTPIEQAPMDMWAQMRFIDHEVLGDRWKDFDEEYLYRTGFMGFERKFRPDKLPEFLKKLEPYCLRIDRASLGIKAPIIHKELFSLFGEQERIYQEMDEHLIAEVNGRTVVADMKVTSLIRLQQITGGFIEDEPIGEAKMRRLRWLLRNKLRPPIVVFCRFKSEVLAVESELTKHYDRVEKLWGQTGSGKSKSKVRADLNRRFLAGEIDGLVCQVKTGSVGIDLYRARQGVVYSTTFSFIDWDQLISRMVHRNYSEPPELFFLAAQGTIDEDIFDAVRDKRVVSEMVFQKLRRSLSWPKRKS